jgi:PAS domain S-box-containing protein
MPFLSVFRKRKLSPAQLAALLATELQKAILAEEDKIALLAKVIECQHHEVQRHPQFAAAIQKVKDLFSAWLDPSPVLDSTASMAEAVPWLQERHGIASSHLFAMLRRMRYAGHQYGAPESFFEHADFFMQTVMEKQRSRHKEAFGAFGKALVIFDSHGNNVDVNDAACKLLGYSKEEMLSPSFNWITVTATPDDAKTVENGIRRLVTSGGSVHYENQYRTVDGRIIAVLNTSSVLSNGFFAC